MALEASDQVFGMGVKSQTQNGVYFKVNYSVALVILRIVVSFRVRVHVETKVGPQ